MTIFVDGLKTYPNKPFGHDQWCHMATDSGDIDELHRMAQSIGLKRAWFQTKNGKFEHYDLTPSRRRLAIARGAVAVDGPDLARLCWLPFMERGKGGMPAVTEEPS